MATITSLAAGLWSAAGTWIGGVPPTTGDKVVINHAVTVDGTYTTGDGTTSAITAQAGGSLIASRLVNSSLAVSGRVRNTGTGVIDYGTDASPIPAAITASLSCTGLDGTSATGFCTFKGELKKRCAVAVSLSGTALVVDDATGWAVGDLIVLWSMLRTDDLNFFQRTIDAIAGNNITLNSALSGTITPSFVKVGNRSANVQLVHTSDAFIATNRGYFKRAVLNTSGPAGIQQNVTVEGGSLVVDEAAIYGTGLGFNGCVFGAATIDKTFLFQSGNGQCYRGAPGFQASGLRQIKNSYLLSVGPTVNFDNTLGVAIDNCDIHSVNLWPLQNGGGFCAIDNTRVRSGNTRPASSNLFATQNVYTALDLRQCSVASLEVAFGSTTLNNTPLDAQMRGVIGYTAFGRYGFIESLFETVAGVPNQHEYILGTGAMWAATDQRLNGATSLSTYRRAGTGVQSYSKAFPIAIGETKRIRFNSRRNATYAAGGMPTVSLSMPGVATVTVAPTDTADTWFSQTLSLTNTTGAAGQITITVQWQGALSASSAGWIDGLALYPYVTQARWYGDVFDESNPFRLVDSTLTLNEAAAAAITGVAIDHGAETITVTAARTAQEIYCYAKWDLCQTANLSEADHISSAGGEDFTTSYEVILSGAGAITADFYTDANGTVRTVSATSTGLPVGARYQLYNVTDAVELENDIAAGELAYSLNFTTTKTLRLRWAKTGLLPQELTAALTVGGASFLCTDTPDAVYIANGIDGATCDISGGGEFEADYPNLQIDTADPDGETSVQRVYAWARWANTTAIGIQLMHNAVTADDIANYLIDVAVVDAKLQNTVIGGVVLIGGGYLRRSDGTTVISSGPGSIQMDPGRAYLAGGSVVDANIVQVNGYTVQGEGTQANPWGP